MLMIANDDATGFFLPFNSYISRDKRPYGLLLVLLFNVSKLRQLQKAHEDVC